MELHRNLPPPTLHQSSGVQTATFHLEIQSCLKSKSCENRNFVTVHSLFEGERPDARPLLVEVPGVEGGRGQQVAQLRAVLHVDLKK